MKKLSLLLCASLTAISAGAVEPQKCYVLLDNKQPYMILPIRSKLEKLGTIKAALATEVFLPNNKKAIGVNRVIECTRIDKTFVSVEAQKQEDKQGI